LRRSTYPTCHLGSIVSLRALLLLRAVYININARTVILAADQTNAAFGVLIYQTNLDKIASLTSHSAMAVSGPNCDVVNFTQYVEKNLQLYSLRNDGTRLSTSAQAHYCRNELATALRRGPFQCNALLAGYDGDTDAVAAGGNGDTTTAKEGAGGGGAASLYWLDYLGTLQKVRYGCQGVATSFCLGIMDKEYPSTTERLDRDGALGIVEKCIQELHARFLPNQPNFIVKCIDKDGVSVIKFGADPADN
jgi:20S proteasome subunit beta 4